MAEINHLRLAFMEYQEAERIKAWSPYLERDPERRMKLEAICEDRWKRFEELLVDFTRKA